MSSVNSISGLQAIMVKPKCWRLSQGADGLWVLAFTYVDPSRGEWAEVLTRGGVKRYRSTDTAIKDVLKVQPLNAVVRVFGNGVTQ